MVLALTININNTPTAAWQATDVSQCVDNAVVAKRRTRIAESGWSAAKVFG